jgi:hypothetical protein
MNILTTPLFICMAGALGGVMFGIRKHGLVLPHPQSGTHTWELGYISDLFIGLIGAFGIFLLIPGEVLTFQPDAVTTKHVVTLLALALLGGYGGPAVVDRALSQTLTALQQRTEEVEARVQQQKYQEVLDAKAFEYVDQQLSNTLEPVSSNVLIETLKNASTVALESIFQIARETRHTSQREHKKGLIERTIPIFQGLLASHYGSRRHRYHAQLGYTLKDQESPQWDAARDALERAIDLATEAGEKVPPIYMFNWAHCSIELDNRANRLRPADQQTCDQIIKALQQGCRFYRLREAVTTEEWVRKWLERNGIPLDEILDGSNLIPAAVTTLASAVRVQEAAS